MAFELHRPGHQQAIVAASAILPRQAVRLAGTDGLFLLPAATNSDRPFGVAGPATVGASGLADGEMCTVYEELNIVKAVAGASLGVGAEVSVGSTNGVLTPAALVAASGHWAVGFAETPAAAGEIFALYVKPRRVS